jgi:hypothetical protein
MHHDTSNQGECKQGIDRSQAHCPCRAFLTSLALHAPRFVAVGDLPSNLLEEFRFDQVDDLERRVA